MVSTISISSSTKSLLEESKTFVSQLNDMVDSFDKITYSLDKENANEWEKERYELNQDAEDMIRVLFEAKGALEHFYKIWGI